MEEDRGENGKGEAGVDESGELADVIIEVVGKAGLASVLAGGRWICDGGRGIGKGPGDGL
jgi:hypothetical protein